VVDSDLPDTIDV